MISKILQKCRITWEVIREKQKKTKRTNRFRVRESIILLIGHLTIGIVPNHVVLSDTVNMFKSRLDKFWQHQDLIYDFKAEISGTGSRSCY